MSIEKKMSSSTKRDDSGKKTCLLRFMPMLNRTLERRLNPSLGQKKKMENLRHLLYLCLPLSLARICDWNEDN